MTDYKNELRAISQNPSHYCNCDACHEHRVFRIEDIEALLSKRELEAQSNGTAFAIKVIDDLHIGGSGAETTDRLFKGLKNTIRDRYKAEVGVDPAPNYPIEVQLTNREEK